MISAFCFSCTSETDQRKNPEAFKEEEVSKITSIDSISASDTITLSSNLDQEEVMDTLPIFDLKDYQKFRFEKPVGETTLEFPDFQMTIEGTFKISDIIPEASGDTIRLFEGVGNYITGKLIQIQPNDKSTQVQLFLTVTEGIFEHLGESMEFDNELDLIEWRKSAVNWKGVSTEFIEDSLGYYRLPNVNSLNGYFEVKREQKFSLRDTFVINYGESQNIGSLIYKDKVCNYGVGNACIRIVLTNSNGLTTSDYVKIIFSHGC